MNHGFEFTPSGLMPLGAYREGQKTGEVASVAPSEVAAPIDMQPTREAFAAAFATGATATIRHPDAKALTPKDVIRLAKARLKEVEREIRVRRKLEAERDQLKRLLDAASGKPLAIVRSLPTRAAKPA